ncbi:transposase [Microvirga aerilata]|nr:transposase [Microvirga aerilata]
MRASPCKTSSSIEIGRWRSARPGTRAGAGFRITGRDGLQGALLHDPLPPLPVEGTISAGVRFLHLRCARYIGLAKTHLQHVLTAAAMNLIPLGAWFAGTPLARTRQSAFTKLMMAPIPTS